MDLPLISLPIQVPETLPLLMHPVAVHFAVVLPLVILILELINLLTKRKALSVSVYILFVLLTGVFLAAYATGVTDGKEAGPLLSDEGLSALKAHKLLGVYLVYLTLLPLALKVLSLFVKKGWSRALYSAALVSLIALTSYQAKEGGELVYVYGANVASQKLLEDKVEALESELEECKTLIVESVENNVTTEDENTTLSDSNTTVVITAPAENNVSKVESVDVNVSSAVKKELIAVKKSEMNSSK